MLAFRILLTTVLVTVLAFALSGCGSNGDAEPGGPEDTENGVPADNGAGSVTDLEGEFASRDKLVDGFPDNVPLPVGTLVLSTAEGVDGREVLVAEITNSAEIDSAAVAEWYAGKLRDAGFSAVESIVAVHNIVRGNKVYDTRIDATSSDGRGVTAYVGPNDYNPGIRFWIDVDAAGE